MKDTLETVETLFLNVATVNFGGYPVHKTSIDKIRIPYGSVVHVDVDGTICDTNGANYASAVPIPENIAKINYLYENNGCKIIYWTARGKTTGVDWLAVTLDQLDRWGCKRHGLSFVKPQFDYFIDDKAVRIEEI